MTGGVNGIIMGSRGDATDQDMLTPDHSPSSLDFLGQVGLNLVSFQLQSKYR